MLKFNFKSIRQKASQYEAVVMNTLRVFFDAHLFIRKHKFQKYLLISGIVCLLLFSISIKLLLTGIDYIDNLYSEKIVHYLQYIIKLEPDDIKKGIVAVFWLIKKAIDANKDAIFSGFFMILGTPFFSFISSKTEEFSTGKSYPFKWSIFIKEIKRGIALSFKNTVKQLWLILMITLIGLVPLVSIITPLLTFVVQAYYNGILMTDYTLERHGYTIKESVTLYKKLKPEMFAIGLGFMFLLLIPVLGWFLAPVYGLVAAFIQFSRLKLNHTL